MNKRRRIRNLGSKVFLGTLFLAMALILIGLLMAIFGCSTDGPFGPERPDVRIISAEVTYHPAENETTGSLKVENQGGAGYYRVDFFQVTNEGEETLLAQTPEQPLGPGGTRETAWLVVREFVPIMRLDIYSSPRSNGGWRLTDWYTKDQGGKP